MFSYKDLLNYEAIIFDLDDTLYNEIDYLRKAYKYVADQIVYKENNRELISQDIYSFLIRTFKQEGRFNLFQRMCEKFNIVNFFINDFLFCLRNVPIEENSIQINEIIYKFILDNFRNKLFFILTNGNVTQQKNKIKALNIPNKDNIICIFSSALGREFEKPSPFFLVKITNENKLKIDDVIFIGNSLGDQEAAKQAGVDFLNINDFYKL